MDEPLECEVVIDVLPVCVVIDLVPPLLDIAIWGGEVVIHVE